MEFKNKGLAEWLESSVRQIMEGNATNGVFVAKLKNGSVHTAYFHVGCCEKIELAAHIQADAMMDAIAASKEGEKSGN